MLDIKYIRENPVLVQNATNAKNFPVDINKLLDLERQTRVLQGQWEELQSERNQLSKTIRNA